MCVPGPGVITTASEVLKGEQREFIVPTNFASRLLEHLANAVWFASVTTPSCNLCAFSLQVCPLPGLS